MKEPKKIAYTLLKANAALIILTGVSLVAGLVWLGFELWPLVAEFLKGLT